MAISPRDVTIGMFDRIEGELEYRPECRGYFFTTKNGTSFSGEDPLELYKRVNEYLGGGSIVEYGLLRDSLQTGDILLYNGKGPFSKLIQFGTMSKWSHVGMVVKSDELGVVLVYQSTTIDKVKDYIDGELKNGVQINLLSDSIKHYRGDVAVRRLVDFERTPEVLIALNNLRQEFKNRPYEEDKLELIKAAYDGCFGENTPDVSTLFCSELVAECLKAMGGDDCTIPSNEFTPDDFAKIKEFGDIKIGEIEYLKRD